MLITYITNFLEFIFIYYIAKSFYQVSYKPTKNDWIAVLTILLITSPLSNSAPVLSWGAGQLLYLIYMTYIISAKPSEGIILTCLSFVVLLIIQLPIATLLSFILINIPSEYTGIIGNFATLLAIVLLVKIPVIKDIYRKILHSALPYRLMLINSYVILVLLLLICKDNPDELHYSFDTILITILLLVMTNICVLYYDQKMAMQKQQLLAYQKNLPIYESLISEIRDNQHEYSNRLQNLQTLTITCTDYDSLRTALERYTGQYAKPLHAYPLLQINMPLLAATLYSMAINAENNGITIQFDVTSEKLSSHASETQLSDFTSTLTQNAIEARKPGDNIYVHLCSKDGNVEFEIRNPSDHLYSPQEITQFFQKGYTTKEFVKKIDSVPHGTGLYNLIKSVTKLKGTIGADCITYAGKNWVIFRLRI